MELFWEGPLITKGNLPARGGHSSCVVSDKIYVFGGSCYTKSEGAPLSLVQADLHCFDTTNLTWSHVQTKGQTPKPRYAHTCVAIGKKVVVLGGFNGKSYLPLDEVYILDTTNGTWFQPPTKNRSPEKRYAHSCHFIPGGKLLIYGGCGPNGVFLDQSISTLDLATMSWNTFQPNGGSCPAARAYHCSVLINRDLYVFGGRSGNTYFNDLYCLHLETMSWERIAAFGQIPSPRSGCASSVLYSVKKEPFIIIIGGMDGTKCFNDVFIFDLNNNKWSQIQNSIGKIPPPRHKHTCSIIGNVIYMIAGMSDPPNAFQDVYVLSYLRDQFVSEIVGNSFVTKDFSPSPKESPNKSINYNNLHNNNNTNNLYSSNNNDRNGEINKLKEELNNCNARIDYLSGKNIKSLTVEELELLENMYLNNLQRIIVVKKEKMMIEMQKKMKQEIELLKAQESAKPLDENKQLVETINSLQNENSKLRKKLKESGIFVNDSRNEVIETNKSVNFGSVSLRTYNIETGQGVPSQGPSIGIGNVIMKESVEDLNGFEIRRQSERRGVTRISSNQRIDLLKHHGVSDDSIELEQKKLDEILQSRLNSITSPTNNPLDDVNFYFGQT